MPAKCVGAWVHTTSSRIGGAIQSPWQRHRYAGRIMTRNRPRCDGLVVEKRRQRAMTRLSQVVVRWRAPRADRHNCVTLHAMVRTRTSIWKEVGRHFNFDNCGGRQIITLTEQFHLQGASYRRRSLDSKFDRINSALNETAVSHACARATYGCGAQ